MALLASGLRPLRDRVALAAKTAVLMDEVDVNLNPKVGSMWMRRGQRAEVETPGNNEERYLAGSIHWRTGRVFLTQGSPKEGRGAVLFLRHLDDLRRALRQYKVSHVVYDNPGKSKAVRACLLLSKDGALAHRQRTVGIGWIPVSRTAPRGK